MASRLSYPDSYSALQQLGFCEPGEVPPIPDHPPQFDDSEPLGVNFFRTYREGGRLEALTLPRTFISKSEFISVSFQNTDLHESTLCWNHFTGIDFTDADLSECDIRASLFQDTAFVRAVLRNADLRHSKFTNCDFTDADMKGTKLARTQSEGISLTAQQQEVIDWQDSDGDWPPG